MGRMDTVSTLRPIPQQRSRSQCHRQHRRHVRHSGTFADAYRDPVSPAPEINKQRFSRFVQRVISDARDRGMSDKEIERRTSVSPSTFHRWRRGDFATTPDVGRITAFCEGLGISPSTAMRALGAEEGRDDPAPEPAMDPDVRRILRALTDPHVSDTDKLLIRETLKMLVTRVTKPGR